jgi:ligand-binding SRPBCC domain-containing protein
MDIVITSAVPEKMYQGLFINFFISAFLKIPITWVIEITHIKPYEYFVDEKPKDPYRIWHHELHFKQTPKGVLMTDLLYYDVGKNIFGWTDEKL